mgnify:CR=1 FL=1
MLPLRAFLTGEDTVETMHCICYFLLHDKVLVLLVSPTHLTKEVQKIAAF